MQALLDDLVDFNRVRFGLGIDVSPIDTDLETLFAEELQQLRAANPGREIDLQVEGDARGTYDVNRLHQLFGNLVSNALKYGDAEAPVRIALAGQPTEVILAVKNQGLVIEPTYLNRIFDPLQRGPAQQADGGRDGNLGLGLYISREIAKAHGGTIAAKSDATGTVFTVRLPRKHAAP